ncbi:MAG: amidohydrolase family protein [Deltaproteobacteria bacterium]|nr:amidohydrolase family protein [Deltaproteobacteria bacterium]
MVHAIKAGLLIDGQGGDPIEDAVLLIEGNTITTAGPAASINIPAGAKITDAAGKTMMPGLIDVHVHVTSMSVDLEQRLNTPKAVSYYHAANNLKRTLNAGFTTVRDAGGADAGIRHALEIGLISGPRLVVSGSIGHTGGLMEMRFPSGAQIVDDAAWRICDGVDDVRKTVRMALREGVDFIKIFATGGIVAPQGSPFIAEWSPSELAVIVEEAKRHGAGVMVHAESADGIKNALRAGVTSIEHGNVLDQEAIDLFLDTGTFLVPTLHFPKVLSDKRDRLNLSEASKKKGRQLAEAEKGWFRRACEAGVKIALGTDAFIAELHGRNGVELSLMMEKGGLSAMEVIVAGTKNAAACCLLAEQLGTLEAGKLADLLLVTGNPLDDIAILQNPERITVYKDGALVQ